MSVLPFRQSTDIERLYDTIQADMHRFKTITRGNLTTEQVAYALSRAREMQKNIDLAIQMLEEKMS